ncbi:MAG: hypothetical protein D6712_06890 [Chloroflexi bacterium]|nr:MAG: hypothetical protein D6712_06890 [Chloroflexota bacterium]
MEQEPGGIINTLVSQARLEAAQQNLEKALSLYEAAFAVADRSGFAQHPVVQGMRQEYERLRTLTEHLPELEATFRQMQEDPLAQGMAALLQAQDAESVAQALADHPILGEAPALLALGALLAEALANEVADASRHLTALFAILLQAYNHAHPEEIQVESHAAVVDLCQQIIPLAEEMDADLAQALREQAGWACNTLGNHYADKAQDPAQAIAAYTRGLAFAPENAMLLRNRAGEHLEMGDLEAAAADMDAAAALEPNAPRLAQLRAALEAARQKGKE